MNKLNSFTYEKRKEKFLAALFLFATIILLYGMIQISAAIN